MWNAAEAIEHLIRRALPHSSGFCAQFTRRAIAAGGVTLTPPASALAKDYGPCLLAAGFRREPLPTVFTGGDVAVITSCSGAPAGHMAMYSGESWISDFRQRSLYPGPVYRREQPGYAIYRYPVLEVR